MLFSGYMEEKKHVKKPFMIYPTEDLIQAYRELAKENNRSVNGEIITVLQQNLKQQKVA